jgi:hypothetical protein
LTHPTASATLLLNDIEHDLFQAQGFNPSDRAGRVLDLLTEMLKRNVVALGYVNAVDRQLTASLFGHVFATSFSHLEYCGNRTTGS